MRADQCSEAQVAAYGQGCALNPICLESGGVLVLPKTDRNRISLHRWRAPSAARPVGPFRAFP